MVGQFRGGVRSDTLNLKQGRVLKRGVRSTCSKMGARTSDRQSNQKLKLRGAG